MEVVDVREPDAPGPGEVLLAPEAVGLCGSDFHYFLGDIGTIDDPAALYPRIQGHEAAAVIVELGAGSPSGLEPGMRVAIWPVNSCGQLLSVPHRSRKRVRADLPDGHSRRRGAAGAARPRVVSRLSGGRPGSRP